METREVKFLAMEYFFLILNRTFEITINENGMHGAVVNQIMSSVNPKIISATQTGSAYDLVSKANVERSQKHVAGSEEFLKLSSSNFSYAKDSISRISYNPKSKWGMGPVPHTGKLYVTFIPNTKREFIVLGKPNILELINNIELVGYSVVYT
jgi:hypothetical protein